MVLQTFSFDQRTVLSPAEKKPKGRSLLLQCFTFGWNGGIWDRCLSLDMVASVPRGWSCRLTGSSSSLGWTRNLMEDRTEPLRMDNIVEGFWQCTYLVDLLWSRRNNACTGQAWDTHLLLKWIKLYLLGRFRQMRRVSGEYPAQQSRFYPSAGLSKEPYESVAGLNM